MGQEEITFDFEANITIPKIPRNIPTTMAPIHRRYASCEPFETVPLIMVIPRKTSITPIKSVIPPMIFRLSSAT